MAHTKSAIKKIGTYLKQRQRNSAAKSLIKNRTRKLKDAVTAQDVVVTETAYRELCSVLDKAAKKGTIKKQTAIRRKSRIAKALRTAAAAKAAAPAA